MKLKDLFESTGKSVADLNIDYQGGDLLLYPADLRPKGIILTSLKGSPDHISGDFYCNDSEIKTLVGGPTIVDGDFICSGNNLDTLEGSPSKVGNTFMCIRNNLTSLKGITKHIGGSLYCSKNPLVSLEGIHKHIDYIGKMFVADEAPIQSHVLGLLLIKELQSVRLDNKQVEEILNRHLGKGRAGMLQAQEELIEAGLEEFAQL